MLIDQIKTSLADYEQQHKAAVAKAQELDAEVRAYVSDAEKRRDALVTSIVRLEGAMTALRVTLGSEAAGGDGPIHRGVARKAHEVEQLAEMVNEAKPESVVLASERFGGGARV